MNIKIFSALAEPRRYHIVELLREGPQTVGEIADRLQIQQPLVSKHLRVLYETGIVEYYAKANRRIYRLRGEPFREFYTWLSQDKKFGRLGDYLQDLQRK